MKILKFILRHISMTCCLQQNKSVVCQKETALVSQFIFQTYHCHCTAGTSVGVVTINRCLGFEQKHTPMSSTGRDHRTSPFHLHYRTRVCVGDPGVCADRAVRRQSPALHLLARSPEKGPQTRSC